MLVYLGCPVVYTSPEGTEAPGVVSALNADATAHLAIFPANRDFTTVDAAVLGIGPGTFRVAALAA